MSKKKQGQRDKVLMMLRYATGQTVTSEQFLDAHIPRYSARILELREAGFIISSQRRDGLSTWSFTLTGEPA